MKKAQARQVELTVEQANRIADDPDETLLDELSGGDLDKAVAILWTAAAIIKAEAARISGLSDEELALVEEDEPDDGEGGQSTRPHLPSSREQIEPEKPEEPGEPEEPRGPLLGEIGFRQCHRFTSLRELPDMRAHVCGEAVEGGRGLGQSYCPACLERLTEHHGRTGGGFRLSFPAHVAV